MRINLIFIMSVLLLLPISTWSQDNPVELGKVEWLRSYDKAVDKASENDKPIFLLFQEVPGCSNCTRYGTEILSHPLIVEFIETVFVPLAIYNNKGGADKKVLDRFNEPSWNNPVVRIIDETGSDLVPRISNFRSSYDLLQAMISVTEGMSREIPQYVKILEKELRADEHGVGEAYFSMYCFWTGEKEISEMEGVLATEAGYMHGHEVVKVKWESNVTNLQSLSHQAAEVKCADQVFANVSEKVVSKKVGKYRKDKEDKYYLIHSPYQYIPMTELQKSLVNGALGKGSDPKQYLSPRQIEFLTHPKSKKKRMTSQSIYEAWY